jgi:hypothetical protein
LEEACERTRGRATPQVLLNLYDESVLVKLVLFDRFVDRASFPAAAFRAKLASRYGALMAPQVRASSAGPPLGGRRWGCGAFGAALATGCSCRGPGRQLEALFACQGALERLAAAPGCWRRLASLQPCFLVTHLRLRQGPLLLRSPEPACLAQAPAGRAAMPCPLSPPPALPAPQHTHACCLPAGVPGRAARAAQAGLAPGAAVPRAPGRHLGLGPGGGWPRAGWQRRGGPGREPAAHQVCAAQEPGCAGGRGGGAGEGC